ncbi:MAG: hypothetical protein ABIY51_11625 [Ferruginibacter sp.]
MTYSRLLFKIVLCGFLVTCSLSTFAQNESSGYDKKIADSLGADDYGMKMYVMVILKTGDNLIEDKKKSDSLFGGHLKNIVHMLDIGKLLVSGPLKKNEKNYRGIFILNASTIEEAKALLENDPAIKAKLLAAEFYNWYGSAALPMYLNSLKKVTKKSF